MRAYSEAKALQEKAQSRLDLDKAIQKYQELLTVFERLQLKKELAQTLSSLGEAHYACNQREEAQATQEKALAVSRNQ